MGEIQVKFRNFAEELAHVEGDILKLAEYSTKNPAFHSHIPKPNKIFLYLGIAAIMFLVSRFLEEKNENFFLIMLLIVLASVVKAVLEYSNYRENLKDTKSEREATATVTQLEERRKVLIRELNQISGENPDLDGDYWWKGNREPMFYADLLPGTIPRYDKWDYMLLNHPRFSEKENGLWLNNMLCDGVSVLGEDGWKMLNSPDYGIVYQNDSLITKNEKSYILAHLYAFFIEPIEEITASTTRTRIDKKAEIEACRQKLDAWEITLNAITENALMTNEEMHLSNRRSTSEYMHDYIARSIYEDEIQRRINAQDDYNETTTYHKSFRNLYRIMLFNCADVLISERDNTQGYAAAILVPRTQQESLSLTVRARKEENPFYGRIEQYGSFEAIEVGTVKGIPSIKMAADKLFDSESAEVLHLNQRNVLESKPESLNDWEHTYLIWKDNPRERNSRLAVLGSHTTRI